MKKVLITLCSVAILFSFLFSVEVCAAELADGVYEVEIALWHSEDDKESMAASAINPKATIKVVDGIKTMYIRCDEMSMMGIKASLQELKIADSSGDFTNAAVISTDSQGNPTSFSFVLPHEGEYISVKVNPHLAIMGNRDIGARIKIDYSSVKLIKSEETTTAIHTEALSELPVEVVTQQLTESQTSAEYSEQVLTDSIDFEESHTVSQLNSNTELTPYENDDDSKNSVFISVLIVAFVLAVAAFTVISIKRRK